MSDVKDQAKAGLEKGADRILEAKETVLERARQVEEETRRRLEAAKAASLEQAEAARKVTATATWWLLAIAVVSGVAAALGADCRRPDGGGPCRFEGARPQGRAHAH